MYGWIDRRNAEARLDEIEAELGALAGERTTLHTVLGVVDAMREPARPAAASAPTPASARRPAAVRPSGGGVGQKIGLLDAIVEALRGAPPRGMTVAQIQERMTKTHPELANRKPALISSAIFQARKSKSPRVRRIGKPGGKGSPARWAAV